MAYLLNETTKAASAGPSRTSGWWRKYVPTPETDINTKDQDEHDTTIRCTIEWIGLKIFVGNIQFFGTF